MRSSLLATLAWLVAVVNWATAAESATPAEPRRVEVGFHLINLPEIDEPAQTFVAIGYLNLAWREPAAAFEGTEPKMWFGEDADEKLHEFWRPNVQFANQATPAEVLQTVLTIKPDGSIAYGREVEVSLESELKLHRFPFDRQTLEIQIESFGYSTKAVLFDLRPQGLVTAKKLYLPQWELQPLRWATSVERDDLTAADYSRVTVSIDVTRRPAYYVWQIFVPLFLLILIAGAVFFLPAGDLADRMNVIVTALLTAVALSYAVHSDLPKISYLTVVDRLFIVAYVFLGAKIVAMLWIKQLLEQEEARGLALDRQLRWLFPAVYGGINVAIVVFAALSG